MSFESLNQEKNNRKLNGDLLKSVNISDKNQKSCLWEVILLKVTAKCFFLIGTRVKSSIHLNNN